MNTLTVNKTEVGLSIIVVNWNTRELLHQCLRSIYDTTRQTRFEIWVIDNDSTDGSAEMVAREFSQVHLVRNNANLGFAKANNIGIQDSRGRYVCLINSDVKVLDGSLDRLFEYLEQNPKTALAGPRLLNPDRSLQISCYGFPSVWNTFCYAMGLDQLFPRSNRFGGLYRKYWPYDRVRAVEVISGCFAVVRREAIALVGSLDEMFFMYMEDFDWCKRFHMAGWQVVYFPRAEAVHVGGGSSSASSAKYWIERNRSLLLYWQKHHGRVGRMYAAGMMLIRQVLRAIAGLLRYIVKPSAKLEIVLKLKESMASIHGLLNSHTSKS
ncbi:MAG TPA: glycosyltransferase family 2 protein [bacterium]